MANIEGFCRSSRSFLWTRTSLTRSGTLLLATSGVDYRKKPVGLHMRQLKRREGFGKRRASASDVRAKS